MTNPTNPAIAAAHAELTAHQKRYSSEILNADSHASEEFDRLYYIWMRLRWIAGDTWVRFVWPTCPEEMI